MTHNNSTIEILAPCGSYDILVAAIHAGADACYIGGNRFGARAYAENFDENAIMDAIAYAHLHGVKLYLTVNTLFKESEITELYAYLKPFYEAGLDAVIVQDLGVFSYIHTQFPDLPIHCSTQMNITSWHGAAFMAKQGAKRIVTAREMSLDAIRAIKEHTDIEVETFVHGAMCYSYSGQCLMSSLAGGRSGNRGRCAQPCRKCYDGSYLLSMKDMCSLKSVPALLEAGIDSFKIEGRMKNAAYVASAVHAYKTIVTDCQNGVYDEKKADALMFELANVYNRGGFSDGYFFRHNGAEMISKTRPNNQGIFLGTITGIHAGTVSIRLSVPLYKQDVLELETVESDAIEITSGMDGKKGQEVSLKCPKTKLIRVGGVVYRTRCPKILEHIQQDYIDTYEKQPIHMHLTAQEGKPLTLNITTKLNGKEFVISDSADFVQTSNQIAASEDTVRKPLCQLGNTDYKIDKLHIDLSEHAFVPAGSLKKLRRDAIEKLETAILNSEGRAYVSEIKYEKTVSVGHSTENPDIQEKDGKLLIGIQTIPQLKTVLEFMTSHRDSISWLTMPLSVYRQSKTLECADILNASHVKLCLELPFVISSNDKDDLPSSDFSGIYIKNIDGLALALEASLPESCEIFYDASLYSYNSIALSFLKHIWNEKRHVHFLTARELNIEELHDLQSDYLMLYEYQPVMVTANCIRRTKEGCDKGNSICTIQDDKGNRFFAKAFCDDCYNVIYNKSAYCILDKFREEAFKNLNQSGYAIRFTIENEKEVKNVLSAYVSPHDLDCVGKDKTNGHLYRGII